MPLAESPFSWGLPVANASGAHLFFCVQAKAEVEKAKRSETGQRAAEGVRNAKATAAEAKAAASAKATELTAKAKEVTAKTFV